LAAIHSDGTGCCILAGRGKQIAGVKMDDGNLSLTGTMQKQSHAKVAKVAKAEESSTVFESRSCHTVW
jgi:formylmethanofuran dehydrogenase subunit C